MSKGDFVRLLNICFIIAFWLHAAPLEPGKHAYVLLFYKHEASLKLKPKTTFIKLSDEEFDELSN